MATRIEHRQTERRSRHSPQRVNRAGWWVAAAATTMLASCSRAPQVDAPPPPVTDDVAEAVPPLPRSVVESQIRYELTPALEALERTVPRTFGDIEERHQMGNNRRAHFAFTARRSPFTISVDSQQVTISSVVEYEGRGWYKPVIGPEVSAACGTNGVPRPRARVTLRSTIRLDEDWSLAARSRVTRAEPYSTLERDKCSVTIFRIDVTDKVVNATRGVLEKQLRTLDRALADANTRGRFERWWRDISRPIRFADSVYFLIQPSNVQLGRIEVSNGEAIAHLRLEVAPRIITGPRPSDFDLFTPLPPLRKAELEGTGMRVTLDAEFGYDVASNLLRKALRGRTLEQRGRRFVIRDVSLSGIGGGRVALGVQFSGSARGLVYLTGTPTYDNVADQLVVPDLSFDLGTADLLVRGLAFIGEDWIRDYLRANARFPLHGHLDQLRLLAVKGMNRNLTDGVALVASLEPAENVTVRATRQALLVRADAAGDIRLEIDKSITVRRPTVAARD